MSPASIIRRLRAHFECNQNANQVHMTGGARRKSAVLRFSPPPCCGANIEKVTNNKKAGMTGMATAFGMPKRLGAFPRHRRMEPE